MTNSSRSPERTTSSPRRRPGPNLRFSPSPIGSRAALTLRRDDAIIAPARPGPNLRYRPALTLPRDDAAVSHRRDPSGLALGPLRHLMALTLFRISVASIS